MAVLGDFRVKQVAPELFLVEQRGLLFDWRVIEATKTVEEAVALLDKIAASAATIDWLNNQAPDTIVLERTIGGE